MVHFLELYRSGAKPENAKKVLIAVHGRGGSAADILQLAEYLASEDTALIAPQANGHTWYPYSFLAAPAQNQPALSSAIEVLHKISTQLQQDGWKPAQIYFMGFSQGACLTLEYCTRYARAYGGVIAFTGGLIGDRIYTQNYSGNFVNCPVYIGTSDVDPHVPLSRVRETEKLLQSMGADVEVNIFPGMAHTVNSQEMEKARLLLQR